MTTTREPAFRESADLMVNRAALVVELPPRLEQKIRGCNAAFTMRIGVRLRGGNQELSGYRSVHSEHMEPVKGGIRDALAASQDEGEALPALMAHKCALVETPFFGSKGAVPRSTRMPGARVGADPPPFRP